MKVFYAKNINLKVYQTITVKCDHYYIILIEIINDNKN